MGGSTPVALEGLLAYTALRYHFHNVFKEDAVRPHRITAKFGRGEIHISKGIVELTVLTHRAFDHPHIYWHPSKYLYHANFQLRYCPSLAKKPIPKLEAPTPTPKKHFDPFANPSPDLHIIDIPTTNPTHLLVLNKFPIIAEHFILATKENKQQTHILEQDDLEATYACLKAWAQDSRQKRLFAFFNSGDHSGASQPHRHIQFLPVEHMRDSKAANGWDLLIDVILTGEESTGTSSRFLQNPNIPFAHFGRRFNAPPTGQQLVSIYNELYGHAKRAVDDFIATNPSEFSLHPTEGGDSPISYNLAMTTEGMVVLPRRSEGTMLKRPDSTDIGFVALNGTTLGGTMMVKHQDERDALRSQQGKLDSILDAIGIPRNTETYKSRV